MINLLLSLILIFQGFTPLVTINKIQSINQSFGIKNTAKSVLVVDLDNNYLLYQKNPNKILPIASLTKLMTAVILLENHPSWEKEVIYEEIDNIDEPEISKINFEPGEKIKFKDLFYASLIKSANNGIKALVRSAGFSQEEFVRKMNEKAKELEMYHTIFYEPTGLDFRNQSTVNDLYRLIKFINQKREIKSVLQLKFYKFKTEKDGREKYYRVKNTDDLLWSFVKIELAKTGFSDEAGYCFAGIGKLNNKKIFIALLGSKTEKDRLQEVKGFFWWAVKTKS
ncbi:D-alanyl-D-alanine carboxypeptidase [bacterium]|nr:D-alanyl-D-alanine carboxypeptidase [bacterium]